ncbi:MAG TPA: hypothetical protein VHC68_01045 [Candidatus Paceibacterota bacterium]|nr:hypothetical protein [Candidatus Paceibacterota bacterium]
METRIVNGRITLDLKPALGNRSRGVEDAAIREKIRSIVAKVVA